MTQPLVSIIVTCHNRADMVCTALDSVWKQTYRPLELVIVDDGSTDHSMAVIEEWCAAHPDGGGFTRIARTFPNGKLCVARNRGLELSHGEFIQYVDDDDWLYPFAVAEKIKAFQQDPTRDVMVNQVDYHSPRRGVWGQSHLTVAAEDGRQLAHILDVHTETYFSPTLMFRRGPLLECGAWTPGLLFADDVDVVIRLALCGAKFGLVDKALSAYNMHGELRQCNDMIYRLADDFWAKLFLDLFAFSRRFRRDSPEIRLALAKQADFYALRQLSIGKFRAAELCWKSAEEIGNLRNRRMKLPAWMRRIEFHLEYGLYTGKQRLKRAVKSLLGRGR